MLLVKVRQISPPWVQSCIAVVLFTTNLGLLKDYLCFKEGWRIKRVILQICKRGWKKWNGKWPICFWVWSNCVRTSATSALQVKQQTFAFTQARQKHHPLSPVLKFPYQELNGIHIHNEVETIRDPQGKKGVVVHASKNYIWIHCGYQGNGRSPVILQKDRHNLKKMEKAGQWGKDYLKNQLWKTESIQRIMLYSKCRQMDYILQGPLR